MDQNQTSGNKGLWTTIIVIVVILAVALVAWSMMKGDEVADTNTNTDTANTVGNQLGTSTESFVAPKTVNVSLTDTGYSPQSLTINQGDTVTFTNNSTGRMWTASAPHPQHTDYPEFDQKAAANAGGTFSFTFNKVGTWKFHNHMNPSQFGSITVLQNGPAKE
jgi:plastocyanin